jgi:hypothetical protein
MSVIAFKTNSGATATRIVRDGITPTRRYSNTTESKSKPNESEMSECTSKKQCKGHSSCQAGVCVCERGWLTWDHGRPCSYEQKSKTITLIFSFLAGLSGLDWFVLSRGDEQYIFAGIVKLLVTAAAGTFSPGERKLVERKLVERKLADENWSPRKLVATKIGRHENWSCANCSKLSSERGREGGERACTALFKEAEDDTDELKRKK